MTGHCRSCGQTADKCIDDGRFSGTNCSHDENSFYLAFRLCPPHFGWAEACRIKINRPHCGHSFRPGAIAAGCCVTSLSEPLRLCRDSDQAQAGQSANAGAHPGAGRSGAAFLAPRLHGGGKAPAGLGVGGLPGLCWNHVRHRT